MDVRLSPTARGLDITLVNGDLALDEGLVTMVLVSLFTDGRASPDPNIPEFDQDLRGYWGDEPADPYRSLLWQLARAKATTQNLAIAENSVRDALAHLKTSEIARAVDVRASWVRGDILSLDIVITRGTARRWKQLWDAVENQRIQSGGVLLSLQFN